MVYETKNDRQLKKKLKKSAYDKLQNTLSGKNGIELRIKQVVTQASGQNVSDNIDKRLRKTLSPENKQKKLDTVLENFSYDNFKNFVKNYEPGRERELPDSIKKDDIKDFDEHIWHELLKKAYLLISTLHVKDLVRKNTTIQTIAHDFSSSIIAKIDKHEFYYEKNIKELNKLDTLLINFFHENLSKNNVIDIVKNYVETRKRLSTRFKNLYLER